MQTRYRRQTDRRTKGKQTKILATKRYKLQEEIDTPKQRRQRYKLQEKIDRPKQCRHNTEDRQIDGPKENRQILTTKRYKLQEEIDTPKQSRQRYKLQEEIDTPKQSRQRYKLQEEIDRPKEKGLATKIKRPMGHIAHLRKQFKSMITYDIS